MARTKQTARRSTEAKADYHRLQTPISRRRTRKVAKASEPNTQLQSVCDRCAETCQVNSTLCVEPGCNAWMCYLCIPSSARTVPQHCRDHSGDVMFFYEFR